MEEKILRMQLASEMAAEMQEAKSLGTQLAAEMKHIKGLLPAAGEGLHPPKSSDPSKTGSFLMPTNCQMLYDYGHRWNGIYLVHNEYKIDAVYCDFEQQQPSSTLKNIIVNCFKSFIGTHFSYRVGHSNWLPRHQN